MVDISPPTFDPNAPASAEEGTLSLYGLPYSCRDAKWVVLPVPWDVTTSYEAGASKGPVSILRASQQVDLWSPVVGEAWKIPMAMAPIPSELIDDNDRLRQLFAEALQTDGTLPQAIAQQIDEEQKKLHEWVYRQSQGILKDEKQVVVLGGDHSTPLGLIRALGEQHSSFDVLQIDAHADLRDSYQGLNHSHACIMTRALEVGAVSGLTQVGVRDMCDAEANRIESDERIRTFTDHRVQQRLFDGDTWRAICEQICDTLSQKVYVSFDIDGLDPSLCPNTGTPVPGGLTFEQTCTLIDVVAGSGRTIIGLDLCEVAPGTNEWDANVGARILYRLITAAEASGKGLKK